jgi:LCP family protein required for cell wall assembly
MSSDSTAGRRHKSALRSNIFLFGGVILAVLFVLSALWLKSIWDEIFLIQPPGDKEGALFSLEKDRDKDPFPDILNVLVLGLDTRDAAARADTIMLLSLNQKTGEINIISVPRDMRVKIPGYGMNKINHAYAYGGVSLTRQVVEEFLDINIDHYIITDFEGFTNIVDILGGIELEIEKKMRYYGIDVTIELNPGFQHLDGDKALQYVRFRNDDEGDFGRVRRQQTFLKTLLQEIIAFRNILKFPRILPEIARNIKTDMELNQALKLANRLKNVEIEEINTFTLPGKAGYIEGISYVLPEEKEIRKLVDRYLKGIKAIQS